jgi:hypothetical protein
MNSHMAGVYEACLRGEQGQNNLTPQDEVAIFYRFD